MNLCFMKNNGTYGKGKYTKGELAQLSRRRMIQKEHDDKSKYTRKNKHKGDWDNWYPDHGF